MLRSKRKSASPIQHNTDDWTNWRRKGKTEEGEDVSEETDSDWKLLTAFLDSNHDTKALQMFAKKLSCFEMCIWDIDNLVASQIWFCPFYARTFSDLFVKKRFIKNRLNFNIWWRISLVMWQSHILNLNNSVKLKKNVNVLMQFHYSGLY